MDNLPKNYDEQKIREKLTESLREQIGKVYAWIDTSEGKIISKATASLASFVLGEPTGVIMPLILECSDYTIRKKFVKHFPELMDRLEKSKYKINQDFLLSELGQKLLRDTLRQIIKEDDERKIEQQKTFLFNAITNTEPNQDRITTYLKILISLETTQLRILGALYESANTVTRIMEMKDSSTPTIPMNLKKDFRELLNIDEELLDRSMKKLESEELVAIQGEEQLWVTGEYDRQYSKEAIHRMEMTLDRILTNFGKDFVRYIQENK